jgi:hypothetical protein
VTNWIFQGIPSHYDVFGDFERGEPPTSWSIGRHRDDIAEGDRAALWIGGRQEPGIYAIGTVTGPPFKGVTGAGWAADERGRELWFCPLFLDRIYVNDPIPKAEISADPRFASARIITQPQAANPFLTTDEQWEVIEEQAARHAPSTPRWLNRPEENVWLQIQHQARLWRNAGTPIYTLKEEVRNFIVEVTDSEIVRRSDQGRGDQQTRISRTQISHIWTALAETGEARYDRRVLRFAYAVVVAAVDGIGYRPSPYRLLVTSREEANRHFQPGTPLGVAPRHLTKATRPAGRRAGGGGGEGPLHAALKAFIKEDPLRALGEKLTYQSEDLTESLGAEVRFLTGDRVDLLMKDEQGRFVVIEVEPAIGPADHIGFHQAGKYRTLVAMEKGLSLDQVRALVAAGEIDEELAAGYARLYAIESFVVSLPVPLAPRAPGRPR